MAVAAVMLSACNTAPKNSYVINGVIGLDYNVTEVALRDAKTGDTIAMSPVVDGAFKFEGTADSVSIAVTWASQQLMAQVYLEPGTIDVNVFQTKVTGTPLNDANDAFSQELKALYDQDVITDEEEKAILLNHFKKNANNLLGESIWATLVYAIDYQEMSELLESAPDNIKNNPRNAAMLASKKAAEATGVGCQFVDFPAKTVDIKDSKKDGLDTTLGAFVALGKPVVVDFWASWCGPCRREIENSLSEYAVEFKDKVTFVGVAVWENSVDDTKKAMEELPISWPIIAAGGRDEGPTKEYGIMGIPHILLIGKDGVIKARDLRGYQIKSAIEDELAK